MRRIPTHCTVLSTKGQPTKIRLVRHQVAGQSSTRVDGARWLCETRDRTFAPHDTCLLKNNQCGHLPPQGAEKDICPRAQQARGRKQSHQNMLRLTTTKVSMIKFAEWAENSLSQQSFAILIANLHSILTSNPVRPPQKKSGTHVIASIPGAENPSYASKPLVGVFWGY